MSGSVLCWDCGVWEADGTDGRCDDCRAEAKEAATTWVSITCEEADALRKGLSVHSTCTDPSGQFGAPLVYTEWGDDDGPVLRESRWPADDAKPCAHMLVDRADRDALKEAGRLVLVAQWEANGLPVPDALSPVSGRVLAAESGDVSGAAPIEKQPVSTTESPSDD